MIPHSIPCSLPRSFRCSLPYHCTIYGQGCHLPFTALHQLGFVSPKGCLSRTTSHLSFFGKLSQLSKTHRYLSNPAADLLTYKLQAAFTGKLLLRGFSTQMGHQYWVENIGLWQSFRARALRRAPWCIDNRHCLALCNTPSLEARLELPPH